MVKLRKIPKVLDDQEQKAFLDNFGGGRTGRRDRLMSQIMLYMGLRVSEVCSLKEEHINFATGRTVIRDGKGSKDRIVVMPEKLREKVHSWIDHYPQGDVVFTTTAGKKVQTSHLRRVVKRAAIRAEIKEAEKVSPHTLRHTAATEIYSETHDLHLVKRLLGHSNLSTTEIYLHTSDDDIREHMESVEVYG